MACRSRCSQPVGAFSLSDPVVAHSSEYLSCMILVDVCEISLKRYVLDMANNLRSNFWINQTIEENHTWGRRKRVNLARGEREDKVETRCEVISFPCFQLLTSVRNAACKLQGVTRESMEDADMYIQRDSSVRCRDGIWGSLGRSFHWEAKVSGQDK